MRTQHRGFLTGLFSSFVASFIKGKHATNKEAVDCSRDWSFSRDGGSCSDSGTPGAVKQALQHPECTNEHGN